MLQHFFNCYYLIILLGPFSARLVAQENYKPLSHINTGTDYWYKNAVIYNLDLDAFLDTDANGIGDFQGLISKLDYLKALGVDAIWLAPFQPSPMDDNGYDITDYYGVNPLLGSGGDFAEFMQQAKARGLRVITDLVINHTSIKHPWFQEARSNPDSEYRDWYVWSDERPEA